MKSSKAQQAILGAKIVGFSKSESYISHYNELVLDNGLKVHITWDSFNEINKQLRKKVQKAKVDKPLTLYGYINEILGRKISWYSDKRRYTHRLKPQGHITDREYVLLQSAFKKLKKQDGLEITIGHEELSIYNNNYRYYTENKKARVKETYFETIIRTNHYPSQIIIEK